MRKENCFDQQIDRTGTNSLKWDYRQKVFGREDVLPMWIADSDWKTSDSVIEAIENRAEHGVFGYTGPGEEADRIITDWWEKRYNWKIDPEWIVYTNGVVPSLRVVIETFSCTGEGVILQPPVYYPFFTSVRHGGSQIIHNQLQYSDGKYLMDYEDLKNVCGPADQGAVSDPTPAMMVLCNPHNPVGRVWTEEELMELADICLDNEVLIVSDDIHLEFVYQGSDYLPLASISEEIARNTITLVSPSKAFNTAGLPAAVAIIPDEKTRRRFENAQDKLLKGPSVFGLEAMKAAYSDGEAWLDDQLEYLEANMEYSLEFIEEKAPTVRAIRPEGTTLLWLDFSPLGLSREELKDLLVNEARVGLDFGHWFGPGGDGFARLNFACPRSTLEEGLKRIARALETVT